MRSYFFLDLTYLTGLVALGAMLLAYWRSRDSFHPLVYLGPMLFSLYCLLPLYLFYIETDKLISFLTERQLEYIQGLNLLGVISLCAGVLLGDKNIRQSYYSSQGEILPPAMCTRINRAAFICGFLGVASFVYSLAHVGGLADAYGRGYGGGWIESGYLREALLLTLPALLWLMTSHIRRKLSKLDWALIILFAIPLLMHGFLGARRGPTFMALVALFIGWYLVRFRRPNLLKVLTGGLLLGLLLLFLVSNRDQIYLGSKFDLQRAPTEYIKAGSGNEYIYGAGTIINADTRKEYFWGKRYFVIFFIRPIPRQLWPSKYEDASRLLGIPNLETNMGTGGDVFSDTLGWSGAVGAAPGIVADMWIEFWWYAFPVLFIIGWAYGVAWRKAISLGGLWIPNYTLMTALALYLVMQTLEAMAFRFLITAAASWLIWRYGVGSSPKKVSSYTWQDRNF